MIPSTLTCYMCACLCDWSSRLQCIPLCDVRGLHSGQSHCKFETVTMICTSQLRSPTSDSVSWKSECMDIIPLEG